MKYVSLVWKVSRFMIYLNTCKNCYAIVEYSFNAIVYLKEGRFIGA